LQNPCPADAADAAASQSRLREPKNFKAARLLKIPVLEQQGFCIFPGLSLVLFLKHFL